LRERNRKAVAPSPKKDDLSDELSKLFDDGTDLTSQSRPGRQSEKLLPASQNDRLSESDRQPSRGRQSDSDIIKENTQKEITQTQAGVRVGSNFTLEECRRYAEHLRSTGQGINNPGGYATTILRTGEADEAIAAFLSPRDAAPIVDISGCPDCRSTGWWYPNGTENGAAKCKHANLKKNAVLS